MRRARRASLQKRKDEDQDMQAGSEGAASESSDDDDWADLEWRRQHKRDVKALKEELHLAKTRAAQVDELAAVKSAMEKEIERLTNKTEALDSAKKDVMQGIAKVAQVTKEKELALTRIEEIVQEKRKVEQELALSGQEASDLAKRLRSAQKEIELEKTLRAGQEKAKDKLQLRVEQAEKNLLQQFKYTNQSELKYEREVKEVQRERAQRLVDVHKIKSAQNERDELRKIAQESVEARNLAEKAEAYMKSIVEPLRMSLRQSEELSNEDTATIAEQLSKIEQLEAEKKALSAKCDMKEVEIRVLKKRIARLSQAESVMQAEAFRMLKAQPEMVRYLTSPSWGELIREVQDRGCLASQGKADASKTLKQSLPHKDGIASTLHLPRMPRDAPVEATAPTAGSRGDEPAWRFAMFLEECKEELEALIHPSDVDCFRRLCSFPAAQAAEHESDQTEKSCSSPNAQRTKIPETSGSLFVGHGLGLKKQE